MYLSTEEVADTIGFKIHKVRRWCKSGMIKSNAIPTEGGRTRHYVHIKDLLSFATSMKLHTDVIRKVKKLQEDMK